MKYEITIEGGFTGIPKIHEGEITIGDKEKTMLLQAISKKVVPLNENIRDGLNYHIKLIDEDINYESVYDEKNIPAEIRKLLALIDSKS